MASTFIRTNNEVWSNKTEEQKNLYKDSIVFLEDSKLIWSNDVYYGSGEKSPILFNTDELDINTTNEYYYTSRFLENLKITKIPIIGNTKVEFNGNNIKVQLPKEIILNDLVNFQGCAKYILNLDNNSCKIDRYDYGDLSNYLIATYNDGAIILSNGNALVFESLSRNRLLMTKGPVFENEILITEIGDTIGSSAFRDCTSLTSVIIPNSVTSIGIRSFYNCKSLSSITIPNSVTSIKTEAFLGCSSLTSVEIPNSIIEFGTYAFTNCTSLTSIIIMNGVTSIGMHAFKNCLSLTSITIPNSVTSIGDYAFSGCKSITSITIPNSVTSIGNCAFKDCSSFTSITIPNSVTEIKIRVFSGCTSLTSVTIPNSITDLGYGSFYNCSSLISITIPNSVTSIETEAFAGCSSLTSIIIQSTNPPTLKSDSFNDTNSNLKIYVPSESVDLYKSATNWSDHADKILPIPN